MDWQGQKSAEMLMQVLLVASAVAAFLVGYAMADFQLMLLVYAGGWSSRRSSLSSTGPSSTGTCSSGLTPPRLIATPPADQQRTSNHWGPVEFGMEGLVSS
ncbi:hypothetical protein ZWY2020_006170 [Hordeum vulgare]|nr:hypothetical protein ZWY2020_006170 [Hordeum vulgare]